MDVRYFLANLLCVFVPLFGIEVWRSFRRPNEETLNPLLSASIVASSVLCTQFNFEISDKIFLNLSIVPLTLGFFLLSWRSGLLILTFYTLLNITLSVIKRFYNGHPTTEAVYAYLGALPRGLFIIFIFAVMMCICSILTRHRSFSLRATGFVICLLLFTIIDYAYIQHVRGLPGFNIIAFTGFVLVFNLIFIIAARLVVAAKSAHLKRMEDVRLEKLELVSQLAASVAHEIRNPITVVQGFTQLMLKNDYDRMKSQEFLLMMQEELNRAESVIADYLQIARSPVEDVEYELNLSFMVQHMINVLQPYALARNVTLNTYIAANLCIYGNHMRVTQAIMNLAKNAIEAHENENSGIVDVHLKPAGEFVELKISDNGKGIPDSQLDRLGQPYYSTKTKGTGLGLTLVYRVVNEINGKINVRSRQGEGTSFTVRIPRLNTNAR